MPRSLRALVFLATLPVAAVARDDASSPPRELRRPNIVFILADDLGYRDLACYGSPFHETPQLDRLAARGVRFTQTYTASGVCSPTRASLLTGRYPARVGITDWLPGRKTEPEDRLQPPPLPDHLATDEVTFAEALHDAGYRTAFIGKWHLGAQPEHGPEHQGFDLNIGGSGKGHPPSYFSPYRLPNLPDGPAGEHLDERLTREAVSFLEKAADAKAPFLLYLAHYAVHTPLQGRPDLVAKYERKLHDQPSAEPEFAEGAPDGRCRIRQTHPVYAAMVDSLDMSVGCVLAALENLGLAENTLVIFTSDNGGLSTAEGWPTANTPLRTGKGWAYEGGIRVPLIIAWPGHIPAGTVSDAVVTSPDFSPTLLDLAGLPARPADHQDGVSFADVLRDPSFRPAERPIYWHYPHYSNQRGKPHGAVRLGRWKLIEWYENGRTELFDLQADPGEAKDLSTREPALVADLREKLDAWRLQVGARMPRPNQP